MKHGAGKYDLYPAQADLKDDAGHTLITAYAAKRPDGQWSLLLINKDPSNAHEVAISFAQNGNGTAAQFGGEVKMVTFGAAEYVWHPSDPTSHADPDGPARNTRVAFGPKQRIMLPKASINVLTGKVSTASN